MQQGLFGAGQLAATTSRRDNLQLSTETTTGHLAYLAEVDDAQIATLEAAIQAVTARKAALPA